MNAIALITDFGTQDHYVGVLKGVLLDGAPQARVIDITHEILPHNIAHGAFVLWQCWNWFPGGTVFLAVVDPGVGTVRRLLIGKYGERYLVCADNGLATFLHETIVPETLHVIDPSFRPGVQVSKTFHGRDIMAPVAARIARGADPTEFGAATDRLELLPIRCTARVQPDGIFGSVLHVDHFGTLVTNIGRAQLELISGTIRYLRVALDDRDVGPIRETFADAEIGAPVAVIGGSGLLEIAVNQGSARERFGMVKVVQVSADQT